MAVSHTHPDHIGNVEEFPQVMLYVQKAEYDWPGEGGAPRFNPNHPVTKLDGDHDVFGDGSVTIISTPGHTPGHQSLLVRLPQTGAVVLSGDAVHFKDNWDNRRVPGFNFSKEADPRLDAAHRRHSAEGARAALDQPRQGAKRRAEEGAGVLSIRGGLDEIMDRIAARRRCRRLLSRRPPLAPRTPPRAAASVPASSPVNCRRSDTPPRSTATRAAIRASKPRSTALLGISSSTTAAAGRSSSAAAPASSSIRAIPCPTAFPCRRLTNGIPTSALPRRIAYVKHDGKNDARIEVDVLDRGHARRSCQDFPGLLRQNEDCRGKLPQGDRLREPLQSDAGRLIKTAAGAIRPPMT